jgi:hypothetical protein
VHTAASVTWGCASSTDLVGWKSRDLTLFVFLTRAYSEKLGSVWLKNEDGWSRSIPIAHLFGWRKLGVESEYLLYIQNHSAHRNRSDLTGCECLRSSFISWHKYDHRRQILSPSLRCHHHMRRCRLHPGYRSPSFSLTIGSRRPHSLSCSQWRRMKQQWRCDEQYKTVVNSIATVPNSVTIILKLLPLEWAKVWLMPH